MTQTQRVAYWSSAERDSRSVESVVCSAELCQATRRLHALVTSRPEGGCRVDRSDCTVRTDQARPPPNHKSYARREASWWVDRGVTPWTAGLGEGRGGWGSTLSGFTEPAITGGGGGGTATSALAGSSCITYGLRLVRFCCCFFPLLLLYIS